MAVRSFKRHRREGVSRKEAKRRFLWRIGSKRSCLLLASFYQPRNPEQPFIGRKINRHKLICHPSGNRKENGFRWCGIPCEH